MGFFDGTEIVEQYTEYDDYGGPPLEFQVGTEFPVGYWDNLRGQSSSRGALGPTSDFDHVQHYDGLVPGDYDMPYWHAESPPTAMPSDLIEIALDDRHIAPMTIGLNGRSCGVHGVYIDTAFGKCLMVTDSPALENFLPDSTTGNVAVWLLADDDGTGCPVITASIC